MASEVKTNKVSPSTGTTLNVGDSGDTLALAVDDVTGFNVGSDAAGDVLYNDGTDYTRLAKPGTPADEVLTFATGATAPSWVAAAAGGLTAASQWRLNTNFTGNAEPIASNLEEVDTTGAGVLGTSMVESSGVFTFPSSGYWYVGFGSTWNVIADVYCRLLIRTTTNDSTYVNATRSNQRGYYNYCSVYNDYIFDVTDTTQCKVGFGVSFSGSASSVTTQGNSSENQTWMTFLRLADTP